MLPLKEEPLIRLIREMLGVQRLIPTLFTDVERDTGISRMQMQVLGLIVEATEAPTAAELGRILNHPRQVIQRAVNELAAADLVVMRENPRHKQARVLVATAKGAKLKDIADGAAANMARSVAEFVDLSEISSLCVKLAEIRGAIEQSIRQKNRPRA